MPRAVVELRRYHCGKQADGDSHERLSAHTGPHGLHATVSPILPTSPGYRYNLESITCQGHTDANEASTQQQSLPVLSLLLSRASKEGSHSSHHEKCGSLCCRFEETLESPPTLAPHTSFLGTRMARTLTLWCHLILFMNTTMRGQNQDLAAVCFPLYSAVTAWHMY